MARFSRPRVAIAAVIGVIITAVLVPAFYARPGLYRQTRLVMDTAAVITVVGNSREKADKAMNAAMEMLEDLGRRVNFFSADSELSAINRAAGLKPVRVSADTYALVVQAIESARISSGAFDPTIGPVSLLWDFIHRRKPSQEEIIRRLPLVDYRKVILNDKDSSIALKDKGMMMDLGGIAKGYGAQKAVEVLRRHGISGGIVAIAGDIAAFGAKPDGSAWLVGIKAPREENALSGFVTLADEAVSTSGDYERFFIDNGIRCHHLLDPFTGYPAQDFQSVTVLAKDGAEADSLSTAVFVLGKEKGLALISSRRLKAFAVFKNGTTYISNALQGVFEPAEPDKSEH